MIESLITSQTRIKLLLKFFINANNSSYLRGLEKEFDEGSNAIRLELNRFVEAGLLQTSLEGNKKLYRANIKHPLFGDLQSIIRKFVGIDQIIKIVIGKLGNVNQVYLEGDLAKGIGSDVIDVVLVGDDINKNYLMNLVEKAEPIINKKVRHLVFGLKEGEKYIRKHKEQLLLIWNQ
jgi:hypothetical protein